MPTKKATKKKETVTVPTVKSKKRPEYPFYKAPIVLSHPVWGARSFGNQADLDSALMEPGWYYGPKQSVPEKVKMPNEVG